MFEPDHNYLAGLVRKVQSKDSNAFAELYGLTYKKVYNYALCYLRDAYLAQDAVQEVYILVLKKIDQLNDAMLFTAWLNQIGFHVCYDICRVRYGVLHCAVPVRIQVSASIAVSAHGCDEYL